MKIMKIVLIAMLILIFGTLYIIYSQQTGGTPSTTKSGTSSQTASGEMIAGEYFPKDASQQKLELILVEDFENCDAWAAKMPPDQGFARAKKVLGAPAEVKKKRGDKAKYCLGVKEWCYKRGFNWTEIKPPTPITVVGKLKGLSIWACGRNFRHRLEIWVRNYQGIEYPIDMGSLNFRGWRRLTARIPMYIPYYTKYIPQYKNLDITRLVIRHDPNEKSGNFYLYLDDLEAVVDTYKDSYDGDDMINEMGMERWEEITPTEGEVKKQGSTGQGAGQ